MNNITNNRRKEFFSTFRADIFSALMVGLFLPYWLLIYPIYYFFYDILDFEQETSAVLTGVIFTIVFFLVILWFSLESFSESFVKELDSEKQRLKNENEQIRNQIIHDTKTEANSMRKDFNDLSHKNDYLKKLADAKREELNSLEEKINKTQNKINEIKSDTKQHLTKLTENNTIGYPWLAELYADIAYIEEIKIANYLATKQRPALGTAAEIKNSLAKEKKNLQKQVKILQNQLNYYESVFPWLEDFKEVDPIEAYEEIQISNSDDEYTRLKKYLSPEEYQKMSSAEKYQLALDRYRNKQNKTAWQIGIDYERYIGYIYELKGYKVTYNGALKGLEDMGRDIIAENEKEILVVQCKYWKKEKTIHEKHIFQLYGTVVLEKMKTKKKVKGVFITSTSLSELAKVVAKELKIEILESIPFDKNYPCIKCNINKTTGEKIYHLPFDQQYDKVQITKNTKELYASTTKEAEEKGFRHAFKHFYN